MNTFGSADNQFALCDPRSVISDRARFRRAAHPDLSYANSLYCPAGRWASRGWVLLPRYEYVQLDRYSTTLQLHIHDTSKSDNVGVIKNLSIAHAQCVTTGLASDDNALYLIEVTDGRGVLHNQWFQFPTTSSYNIRAPAYPQVFHPQSMNGSTTWTWSTMLEDLWTQMGTFLGAWPGLPSTPSGTPEGFWFTGIPAWTALCDILDHLGMQVACNLTDASPFTIVASGAADTAHTALETRYTTHLEDDLEWLDVGAARVPRYVKVMFKRRNSVYGTEETVRRDSPQWDMTPLYSVTVNAPSTFSSAVGTHHIWSDFTVRYDNDGSPLAADTAEAAIIAAERVEQYFATIYDRTLGRMTKTYAGALPFKTGSRVDGVCWYQNYRDDSWAGWRTQIVRGSQPPWPEMWE